MYEYPFQRQIRLALSNPVTTERDLERLAHNTLINICLCRDDQMHEEEELFDLLLRNILADPRFLNQDSIKRRMDALY